MMFNVNYNFVHSKTNIFRSYTVPIVYQFESIKDLKKKKANTFKYPLKECCFTTPFAYWQDLSY